KYIQYQAVMQLCCANEKAKNAPKNVGRAMREFPRDDGGAYPMPSGRQACLRMLATLRYQSGGLLLIRHMAHEKASIKRRHYPA
ncbi:MAG TPA: hypothetical protein VFM11_12795, partial [Burkholderiales bacterium]|nr:hypothetical protein [Burkholderiales bacterium]